MNCLGITASSIEVHQCIIKKVKVKDTMLYDCKGHYEKGTKRKADGAIGK